MKGFQISQQFQFNNRNEYVSPRKLFKILQCKMEHNSKLLIPIKPLKLSDTLAKRQTRNLAIDINNANKKIWLNSISSRRVYRRSIFFSCFLLKNILSGRCVPNLTFQIRDTIENSICEIFQINTWKGHSILEIDFLLYLDNIM